MENYKLRIILYGKETNNDLTSIANKSLNNFTRENKYKKEYLNYKDNNGWEYLVFSYEISNEVSEVIKSLVKDNIDSEDMNQANNEIKTIIEKYKDSPKINDEINKINNKYRNFYDIIVVSVNSLSDDDSKLAFKFFQNLTVKRCEQPFLLFLTKKEENPNVEEFYELITNEFFDKRNLFAFKFPKNDNENTNLFNFFIKCMNYYHEIGTFKSGSSHSFNILICGPAGVGKSTFINQFLQEKQAKEGEGMSITHNITKYYHPLYPITLFDTPGFEDEETVKMVLNTLKQFKKDINNSKNHIDLILYYTKLNERTFLKLEIELIETIINDNTKMLFVLNSHGKGKKASNTIRLVNTMKDSLAKIVNCKNSEKKAEILDNILLINQIQSTDEDSDGNPIIKQCYGMDELFQKIYDIFKDDKIVTNEIINSSDINSFKNNIKKYKLLNHIQNVEDIFINLKITASKDILDTSRTIGFWNLWIGKDTKRKELLKRINEYYGVSDSEDIEQIYHRLEEKVKDLNEKETINNFFKSIERFKGYFKTDGFIFDPYFYNKYTISLGYNYLIEFEKEYGQYDDKTKNFIKDFSNTLNKAINSFEEISKEWKEVYNEIKSHKSEKKWVKRFFIIEDISK